MARARLIYPSIWHSPEAAPLTDRQKLLFIGLITLADDYGRGAAEASRLRIQLFPLSDVRPQEIGRDLAELVRVGLVQTYREGQSEYYYIVQWERFNGRQLRYRAKSTIPEPSPETKELSAFSTVNYRQSTVNCGRREEKRREGYSNRTTGTDPVRRTVDSKAAFFAKRRATAAASLYRFFAGEYQRLYSAPYPDAPAPCVKLLQSAVKQTSATAAQKAIELHWEEIRRIQIGEWKGQDGPPHPGGKPAPTVRAFVARLAQNMSANGTGYQKLIEQDRAADATAWAEHKGGLFA